MRETRERLRYGCLGQSGEWDCGSPQDHQGEGSQEERAPSKTKTKRWVGEEKTKEDIAQSSGVALRRCHETETSSRYEVVSGWGFGEVEGHMFSMSEPLGSMSKQKNKNKIKVRVQSDTMKR